MWIVHLKDGNTINELMQKEFTELANPEDITSLQIFKEGTFFTVSRINSSHRLIMQKVGVTWMDSIGETGQKQTGHIIYCIYSPMGDAEGWFLDWANGVIQRIYFNVYQKKLNLEMFKINHEKIRFGSRPSMSIYNFKQIVPHREWEEVIDEETGLDEDGNSIFKKVKAVLIEDLPFWECRVCHQYTAYTNNICLYCGIPREDEEKKYLNKGRKRIK